MNPIAATPPVYAHLFPYNLLPSHALLRIAQDRRDAGPVLAYFVKPVGGPDRARSRSDGAVAALPAANDR